MPSPSTVRRHKAKLRVALSNPQYTWRKLTSLVKLIPGDDTNYVVDLLGQIGAVRGRKNADRAVVLYRAGEVE